MRQNFNTLLQTIRQYKLFPPKTHLLMAVSGGADSLALLHWLIQYRDLLQITISVATLDHGIRSDAQDDVVFIETITQEWQVPCISGSVDVPLIAQQKQMGIEATARQVRYQFLAETAKQVGATHIVTGHHADDQSETILMHIIRGSGIDGLIGMPLTAPLPHAPELQLVRPMLYIRRAEIDAYCSEHDLHPRIDDTNFDTSYRRNDIRHEILPRLRQINPQIDSAFARLSDIAQTETEYIREVYQKNFRPQAKFDDRVTLSLEQIITWHRAVQRQFLRDALVYLDAEVSYELIENAIDIIEKGQVGAIAEFVGDVRLRIGYDYVSIEPHDLLPPTGDYVQLDESLMLTIPGEVTIGEYKIRASWDELNDYDAVLSVPEKINSVTLRTREAGDRFQPRGMAGHSQKIKKWLIDNKIPSFVRDRLPLVTLSNIIVAIILPHGWRIAEKFAKDETSQWIIYFKVVKL